MRLYKNSSRAIETLKAHPKSWGSELWIENNKEYCGKILIFNAGGSTSMHFHILKLETMFLESGEMKVILIDPENGAEYSEDLLPGDSIQIPRGQPHKLVAVEQSRLFEFSTQHFDSDSYRISAPGTR